MNSHAALRTHIRDATKNNEPALQESAQDKLVKWFIPRQETQVVEQQASKGMFLPYPLLGIIMTLSLVLVSGIIALQVQISNLNTTLLLREEDHSREVGDLKQTMAEIKGKNEQLQVYITNDREKLVAIETKLGIRRN